MKKNFIIALILMSISLLAGLTISAVNVLVEPIITENEEAKKEDLCKKIFASYDSEKSVIVSADDYEFSSDYITEKITANDASENFLGYIYTVTGKNSFGTISLLVGLDSENKLVSLQVLENGQTTDEVSKHIKDNYVADLTIETVNSIDTKCGGTFGAKLTKALVQAAFLDAKGGNE